MVKTSLNTPIPLKRKQPSPSPPPISPTPLAICQPTSTPLPETSKKPKMSKQEEEVQSEETQSRGEEVKIKELTVKERKELLAKHKLMDCYALNFKWCTQCKFSELIDILETQQLVYILDVCSTRPMYVEAVEEFKKNFTFDDGVCMSSVDGKTVLFDASSLGKLFQVPADGFDVYERSKEKLKIGDVSCDEIIRFVGGNPNQNNISQSFFSPLTKLLFNIVWRMLVPRTQHRNEANLLDACLIYCLATKTKINLPALIIKHLSTQILNKQLVSYSNLLTTIFESSGVDLTKYQPLPLKGDSLLDEKMMDRLGLCVFDKKTSYNWVHKDGGKKMQEMLDEVPAQNEEVEDGTQVEGEPEAMEEDTMETPKEEVQKDKGKSVVKEEKLGKKRSSGTPMPKRRRIVVRKSSRVAWKRMEQRDLPSHIDLTEGETPVKEREVPNTEVPPSEVPTTEVPPSEVPPAVPEVPDTPPVPQPHPETPALLSKLDQITKHMDEYATVIAALVQGQEHLLETVDKFVTSMKNAVDRLVDAVQAQGQNLNQTIHDAKEEVLQRVNEIEFADEDDLEDVGLSPSPSI